MNFRKIKYIIISIILFFIFIQSIAATTIRETVINGDGFDTILPNTFIIGVTKFSGEQVITASKASTAGANDALVYALKNGTTKGYKAPTIYYYVDANVGWFEFDSDNNAKPVTDAETLNKLSNLDIYYVNNIEKKLEVNYSGASINASLLENGVEYKDNKLFVNATITQFEIETTNGKKINFIKDETTSNFVEDNTSCYTLNEGIITDYDAECGNDIIIPTKIGDNVVVGIAENAFNGKNLEKVVIPSSIKSIGDNAFLNNPLTVVMLDGKYDETDFDSLSSEAFPVSVKPDYSNELTKPLNSLPDEYTVKVYSGLDINSIEMGPIITNEVFKEINSDKYSFHIEQSELEKFYMIHYYTDDTLAGNGECTDHVGTSFDIYFTIETINQFHIYFQKRLNNCTRIITVNKIVKVNYEKVGNLFDKVSIDNALNDMDVVDDATRKDIGTQAKYVTKRRNLEDFIDNNNLEYLYNSISGKVIEPRDNISGSLTNGDLYLFKDEILYQVVNNFEIINLSNAYYLNKSPNDYESMDRFINDVIIDFKEKTNVNNYTFLRMNGVNNYIETTKGARKIYYIGLFDIDNMEYWSIYSRIPIEDNYDANGFTKKSCFTFDNGIITQYDGNCGANVKIPNSINNMDITRIDNNVFYDYGLESIELPNKITSIGSYAFYKNNIKKVNFPDLLTTIEWGAFANNKIETLRVPGNVLSIAGEAFRNNQIKNLSLTNLIHEIGDGAFVNNQLEGENAFIYAREYDSQNDKYVINNSILNSYAGKNRENITIPSNVKIIGNYAFQNLGIHEIDIPYGVESIGAFAFADNYLFQISVPSSVKNIEWGVFINNQFQDDNSFIYFKNRNGEIDKTKLVAYSPYIPSGVYNYKMSKVEIPKDVKVIWDNAFSNVNGIYADELIIPYGIEEIGNNSLINVYVKKAITIPKSVTKIGENIFSYSFTADNSNAYVYARNEDGTVDKTILMAYASSGDQMQITLPSEIKRVRENVFNGKTITGIELNEGLEMVGERSFANMYYLEELVIPSSLKIIEQNSFADNYNLKNLTLKNGVEVIKNSAFINHHLNEIVIPESVRKIEDYAFGYIENVKIYGKSSLDEFDGGCYLKNFDGINIEFINGS